MKEWMDPKDLRSPNSKCPLDDHRIKADTCSVCPLFAGLQGWPQYGIRCAWADEATVGDGSLDDLDPNQIRDRVDAA